MRKQLSVLMLMVRCTIYRVVALLLVMVATEFALFGIALHAALAAAEDGAAMESVGRVIAQSHIAWVFAMFFILMAVLLSLTGCEYGSKVGYTLRRLSILERTVFLWQSVYNTLCFFVLWAVQTVLAYGLCRLYVAAVDPSLTGAQTIFLAFYGNAFLHSLLPLAEISRWIRNLTLVVSLGIGAAYFSYGQRRGKHAGVSIAMVPLTLTLFTRSVGSFLIDIQLLVMAAILAAVMLKNVLGGDACEED